ncbi:TonB-dependent receptor domain-containing protein [Zhouia sp. PK063]|uniref:TonB-dependent receptor domain-containing protein n=1 Tax=Zhouia sp. PK063 TaxID=3373602 RepID=UPI00378E8A30
MNKRKHHTIMLFLFFCTLPVCYIVAQSITGTIISENKDPLSYVNVVLLSTKDSIMVKGTSSLDNGSFSIENITAGSYILKTSFIGFSPYYKSLTIKDSDIHLGHIVLKENVESLDEVVLRQPQLERKVDRLVFNIQNTSLSQGNLMDVLRNTPGVMVINNNITVRNNPVTVYINDRRVYLNSSELTQLLNGTSAFTIKSVEVITHPPAKYDAEGGAIINIVMTKNVAIGYKGSITGNYTQGVYPKYQTGINQYYKTNKLNLYGSYNYTDDKTDRLNDETINFMENGAQTGLWKTHTDRDTWSEKHVVNAIIDYDINKNNTLSITANAILMPYWKRNTTANTNAFVIPSNSQIDSSFTSLNNTRDDLNNMGINAIYEHKFNDKGEKLSINAHTTYYDYNRFQDVHTKYYDAQQNEINSNTFQSDAFQKVNIYTAQADYILPTETTAFETGIKYGNIGSDSNLNTFVNQNGVYEKNAALSDLFLYNEDNYAAYVSYSKNWTNWSLKAGLRGEYTETNPFSTATNTSYKNKYFKLFPTLHIQHTINENNDLGFAFSKRISRPNYSSLNPFRFYLNDNSYVEGNPMLQPTITHKIAMDYTLKQTYTFEVSYQHYSNYITELGFQENDTNILKYVSVNTKASDMYSLDVMVYKNLKNWWTLSWYSSFFYSKEQFYALENNNEITTNDKLSAYIQAANYFTISNTVSADATLLYISPIADGSSQISSRTYVNLGLKKSLWNNRASVSFRINDLLNTANFTSKNNYANQNNSNKARFETQTFQLGFSYKFGNFRLTTNEKDIQNKERERLERNQ